MCLQNLTCQQRKSSLKQKKSRCGFSAFNLPLWFPFKMFNFSLCCITQEACVAKPVPLIINFHRREHENWKVNCQHAICEVQINRIKALIWYGQSSQPQLFSVCLLQGLHVLPQLKALPDFFLPSLNLVGSSNLWFQWFQKNGCCCFLCCQEMF